MTLFAASSGSNVPTQCGGRLLRLAVFFAAFIRRLGMIASVLLRRVFDVRGAMSFDYDVFHTFSVCREGALRSFCGRHLSD